MAIDGVGAASPIATAHQSVRADKTAPNAQIQNSNDFGTAVALSISEEAQAFLSAASSGALTGGDKLASGIGRELTGVIEGISEAVEIALDDDLQSDERTAILAAGEIFAKDIEAIFNEFAGKPLSTSAADDFLERVAQAEDEFFDVFESVYGEDMSDGQADFFDSSMDKLESLFEGLEARLGGRELSAAEDAAISKADGKFYDVLDNIMSRERDPTDADARLIDKTLADLSKAIETIRPSQG